MSKKRKARTNRPGPNPDPERYVWVHTREGGFYRLKRGLGSEARLNESYQKSADSTKVTSPAASRLVRRLCPHLEGLVTGRITVRFNGMLKKALLRKGHMDFSFFEGYDLQRDHPMGELLKAPVCTEVKDGTVRLSLPIDKHSVQQHNTIVSHYFFDAVLLWGDPGSENGLRVDSETSPLYSFSKVKKGTCALSLVLPEKKVPWMVLLKVSCLEGEEMAYHPRHYGMKVVKVGGG